MITKIIHQTWKTRELPGHLQDWHNVVKELHPGWDVKLWTDEDNLKLVKENFPHLLEIYKSLEYNIMRADMIRYMYMFTYGGYYLDLDYELFISFDKEINNTGLLLPLAREKENDGKTIIGNCIFGSTPQHPFWKDVLSDLHNNPPLKKIRNKISILKLTGPEFITSVYFKNPEKYNGTMLARNIFHPPSETSQRSNYKNMLIKSGTRGIHHCEGSWLDTKNPFKYVMSKIKFRPFCF
jgi:mannosyltransferase OCH1-like enzyme